MSANFSSEIMADAPHFLSSEIKELSAKNHVWSENIFQVCRGN